jgi:hypothetical protein
MSAPETAGPEALPPESPAPAEGEGTLEARVREVAHDANDALNGISDALGLTERVEQHPYGAVAAALGLGYVVGGGLFTPTTVRLVKLGLKLASVPLVRERLVEAAEVSVDHLVNGAQKPPQE